MKEHTRNVIGILCLIVLVQPWLIQNAYSAVIPETYDDYDLAADLLSKIRYTNTTDDWTHADYVETFTANNTFTITGTPTAQSETDPCALEFYWAGTGSSESDKFNDTAFEVAADKRITSILVTIYSDDDAFTGALKIGFATAIGADYVLIADRISYTVAASKAAAVTLRVYVPLPVYSLVEDETRFDTAPFIVALYCGDGADMTQTFTVAIVFEKGANFAAWEQYLMWFGLLNFAIAIGMTKMYDMTPGRSSNSGRRRSGRRRSRRR